MENKFLNKLSTLLFYFSILTFIIAFNFADNPAGGWYQQFMPDLNGRSLTDITFLDSLTGFAVTDGNSTNNGYILKTTNGGDNWIIKHAQNVKFNKVQFVNSTTGFVDAYVDLLFKTTNAGENWFTISLPSDLFSDDMWVLNEDTIWLAQINDLVGGLFRTTNGGQIWMRQYYQFGNQPNKIYMYNSNIGFMYNQKDSLFKTTNSGMNWFRVPGGAFTDIYFIDSLIGWKAYGDMKKTMDGGLSWVTQQIPPKGGIIETSSMETFSNINGDTIWGAGGNLIINPGVRRGLVYQTTNGGIDWGYQAMNYYSLGYYFINFTDKLNGWANDINGVHTKSGGNDSTFYTGVKNLENVIATNFKLQQNYPNPFNPTTIISYELRVSSYVELKIFNILGRELQVPVKQKQNSGKYKVEFNGSGLSSGIYFYSLFIDGKKVDTKKMVLVR